MPTRAAIDLKRETGRGNPLLRRPNHASNRHRAWRGFRIDEYEPAEWTSKNVSLSLSAVYLVLDNPLRLEWQGDGARLKKTIAPGRISVLPADHPHSVRVRASGGSVVVSMEDGILASAAAAQGYFGEVDLSWAHGVEDPLVREIVTALRNEMGKSDAGSEAYAESLVGTLAAHIVRLYGCGGVPGDRRPGGLSEHVLKRTIKHVHMHLEDALSVQTLAELSGISPFHFSRLFNRSTGMTPHQYVVSCRVARAKKLLTAGALPLAEVAVRSGFYDQAHLNRCFRRLVGTTPASFSRSLVQ